MRTGLRNLLIVTVIVGLLYFLPLTQTLLVILLLALARVIVVFLTQNFALFRRTSLGEIIPLLLRTLLLWSPILLFYLPQYWLNKEVHKFTTEQAYESGLLERHYVTEATTLYNLDRQFRDSSFLPDTDERIRQHLREALIYAEAKSDSLRDAESVVPWFEFAFQSLEPGLTLSPAADSALEVSQNALDLVVRKQGLVGENEFQLDTELTLQDIFRDREEDMTGVLDSIDREVTAGIQSSLDSINRNLSSTSASAKEDLANARRSIERSTDRELDELEKQTIAGYEKVFPEKLVQVSSRFENSDCGLVAVSCRVLNGVKGILRGVYFEQRREGLKNLRIKAAERKAAARQKIREQLASAEREAIARIDRGEDGVQAYKDSLLVISRTTTEAVDATKAEVRDVRLALNDGVRNGMWSVQRYLQYLRWLSLAVFIFLVVTSFIYVFSRVAFARNTSLYMTLRDGEERGRNSQLTAHGTGYTIPADHQETFYVSKRFVPTGRAPKLAIPQPLVSAFRRLATGTYFMNQITARAGHDEPVDFRSTGGAEFVEWTLAEGEEVIFTYDHLVAFSGNIRLSSHLSLRLTTLLLGRPFFYIATGPGRLVLLTKGAPILSGKDSETRSVSAERVVAWQRPALFSVQSETNLVDIYFSSLYLQRSSEELVLIDADDGNTRHKTGLFRFVLRFLLPI